MLQQLTLENFKGHRRTTIDFGRRITVFIGPNGTGKSSILQALIALRQSLGTGELVTSGPLINLGMFEDVLSKDAPNEPIAIHIRADVGRDYRFLEVPGGALFSYHAYFTPSLADLELVISTPEREYLRAERRGRVRLLEPTAVEPENTGVHGVVVTFGWGNEVTMPISVIDTRHPTGMDKGGEEVRAELNGLLSTIRQLLSRVHGVPAIRGLDQPEYPLMDQPNIDCAPGSNADIASTFIYGGRRIEDIVSMWTEDITGSQVGAPVIPGRMVRIRSYSAPGGIPVIGDGFGTNQLVRLLLTLALAPSQAVIGIEEPEIHLHPKAQTRLCNIIAAQAKDWEQQIVVTTHSEHVLFAFANAVRDGTLTLDDLAIYNFPEKGQEPCRVEQDEHGDIYGDWRRTFFHYKD